VLLLVINILKEQVYKITSGNKERMEKINPITNEKLAMWTLQFCGILLLLE
jgi:hypothetical protein